MTNKNFWELVCGSISGRAGSAEAVRLFQMKEPVNEVLPKIKEKVDKKEKGRSIRPNRGEGPR